jgi:Domain of unknown function (DUF4157)
MKHATLAATTRGQSAWPRISTIEPARAGLLQRKCACDESPGKDEECSECRLTSSGLQRFAASRGGPAMAPPIVQEVLRSPGQPLAREARAFMEPRFGHDFSQVKVHTDAKASASAQAVNALAYTVGSHVVFAGARYQPSTIEGRRLLAHELTHVVQQASATTSERLDRQTIDGAESDEAEDQASAAEIIIMGDLSTAADSLTDPDAEDDSTTDDDGPAPVQTTPPASTSSCPVTARFLMLQAGAAKANCQKPQGTFGPTPVLAAFNLAMPQGSAAAGQKIDEQFTPLEDPNGLASLLKPQSTVTDNHGRFDDCYMIASTKPDQFRLKVEQNHLLNGSIISKNQIVYTDQNIRFCHFERLPGKCEFGARCKL